MNLKEIREIINLMNEHGLTEIEVEREGAKIKIKKSNGETSVSGLTPYPVHYSAPSAPAEQALSASLASNSNLKEIVSPMVGTFYRSPSPESPPFVEIGQTVEIGQVVCIVEAMKLMNEIKSEIRGKVVEMPINNAQPVEFGQVLFKVEPI